MEGQQIHFRDPQRFQTGTYFSDRLVIGIKTWYQWNPDRKGNTVLLQGFDILWCEEKDESLIENPIIEPIAAISIGIVDGEIKLDLPGNIRKIVSLMEHPPIGLSGKYIQMMKDSFQHQKQ